ncbi:MAG: hypothetical protein CVU88_07105 [Firmicutes bacterium HGW-Firmicutes-13]|nr:MAG: hypothetical protein CVU88_07105 [Firmicutes bacterium HGW-Firmicutes-13]
MILQLQHEAIASGNPPFAAVLIADGKVISSSCNKSRSTGDPLQHAEMLTIRSAIENHGSEILLKAHLISSNEPCPMCIGACIWSGIREVTYFLPQEQVAAIRGWGKFMSAHNIAAADDSGILVHGPIEHDGMRKMHQDFWTAERNYSIRIEDQGIPR